MSDGGCRILFVLGRLGRGNVGNSKRVYSEAEKWRGRLVGEAKERARRPKRAKWQQMVLQLDAKVRAECRQSWAICHKMARIRAVSHAISEDTVSSLQDDVGIRRWDTDSRFR